MRGKIFTLLGVIPMLLLAVPTADAQSRAEGWVALEFLEDEVTILSGENVSVPLQVRAEIECDGIHRPPGYVEFSGRYGVAWTVAGGAYYSTQVDPPTVPFELADSTGPGVPGPVLYKVDLKVNLRVETEVPVDEPIEHAVVYSTVGFSSTEGCTVAGWNLPSAEGAAFDLHVLPPPTIGGKGQVEESAGTDGALVFGLLTVAIAAAFLQRRP